MNVVPGLKYELQKSQNNRIPIRRNNIYAENSISIESSDEEGELEDSGYSMIHENGKVYSDEKEFQLEIDNLKLQSNIRFRNKWENILEKYSKIDDEKESDEIDLETGKILKDNGHLKSLRSTITGFDGVRSENNIWSPTYDIDRDLAIHKQKENRERRRKRELKSTLKDRDMFYNSNLHRESIPSKDFIFKEKREKEMNTLEDNLVLLNPSPTKKPRLSTSSPIKGDDFEFISPTKNKVPTELYSNASSPIKRSPGKISYLDIKQSTPVKRKFSLNNLEASFKTIKGNAKLFAGHSTSNILENSDKTEIQSKSNKRNMSGLIIDDNLKVRSLEETESELSDLEHEHSASLDFDEIFSIVSNSFLDQDEIETSKLPEIFTCAFVGCNYCTGNKYLYQSHLLETHTSALCSIGYPINIGESHINSKQTVSTTSISLLTKHFPLSFSIPPLPLSVDGNPINCNLSYKEGKCKKTFLSKFELKRHHSKYPSECSSKKQVYICPLLGCGFITDEGYLSFRSHFIEKEHHMSPSSALKVQGQSSVKAETFNTISPWIGVNSNFEENPVSKELIKKEIDNIFSATDSEFSEDISDFESANEHSDTKDANKSSYIPEEISDKESDTELDLFYRVEYPTTRKIIHGNIPNLCKVDDPTGIDLLHSEETKGEINSLFD